MLPAGGSAFQVGALNLGCSAAIAALRPDLPAPLDFFGRGSALGEVCPDAHGYDFTVDSPRFKVDGHRLTSLGAVVSPPLLRLFGSSQGLSRVGTVPRFVSLPSSSSLPSTVRSSAAFRSDRSALVRSFCASARSLWAARLSASTCRGSSSARSTACGTAVGSPPALRISIPKRVCTSSRMRCSAGAASGSSPVQARALSYVCAICAELAWPHQSLRRTLPSSVRAACRSPLRRERISRASCSLAAWLRRAAFSRPRVTRSATCLAAVTATRRWVSNVSPMPSVFCS